MASRTAILAIRIIGDAKAGTKALDDTAKAGDVLSTGLDKAARASKWALAGIVAGALGAGAAASQLEQNIGAVDAVFGRYADRVHKYGKAAAKTMGLSRSEYSQFAAVVGSQLNSLGVPMDQLADQTNWLIQKGSDLAAQFGGSTSDAVSALSALLRGERDPIERYGVSIKQADVEAQKAKMGLKGLSGEAAKNADYQATLALLTDQTASSVGRFAAESDTAAGKQAIANAKWKDAYATLGQQLLPIMVAVAGVLGDLAGWVDKNQGLVSGLVIGIAALAAAFVTANTGLKAFKTGQEIFSGVRTVVAGAAEQLGRFRDGMNSAAAAQSSFSGLAGTLGGVARNIAQGTVAITTQSVAWVRNTAAMVAQKTVMLAQATATKAVTAGQWLLNAAMSANPVGLVIVAIVALIAVFVLLWTKSAAFRNFFIGMLKQIQAAAAAVWAWLKQAGQVTIQALIGYVRLITAPYRLAFQGIKAAAQAVFGWFRSGGPGQAIQWLIGAARTLVAPFVAAWNAIKAAAQPVFSRLRSVASVALNAILAPIRAVRAAFDAVVSVVRRVIDFIKQLKFPSPPGWLSKIVGGSAQIPVVPAAPAGWAAPSLRRALGLLEAGSLGGAPARPAADAGSTTINIYGALDPDAVARQVQQLLTGQRRRAGLTVLNRRVA